MRTTQSGEIVLITNDERRQLRFSEARINHGVLECRAVVRSGNLGGEGRLFAGDVAGNLMAIRRMVAELRGETRFCAAYEDNWVAFAMNPHGHLPVTGSFIEHGALSQQLEFGFRTDQTALGPFLQKLEELWASTGGNQ